MIPLHSSGSLARRAFLRRAGHLGLAGVAAPWGLNLAAMGEAAAFSASDYKALVCVFLYGGNDNGNTVMPVDNAGYASYAAARTNLATAQSSLAATTLAPVTPLANGAQLALAPQLGGLKSLFDSGNLAVQLNVGPLTVPTTVAQYKALAVPLPPKLFSHNDQQSVWQSSAPEGSTAGWGGKLGDLALANNGNSVFTCISVTGNAVFLAGDTAVQYQISNSGAVPFNGVKNGVYGSSACGAALKTLITAASGHNLENELSKVISRSINTQATVTSALAGVPAFATPYPTGSSLANQLQMVAKLIAARNTLGPKRQVFMVSMGGFDLHDNLLTVHPGLLTQVNDAMTAFYKTTVELGVANSVTAFTASDFGRTLTSNGDGADHGWGSHHFVLGGAVKGQRIYGGPAIISVNGANDVGQGRLLPTTAVNQFAATLASWFGVADSELGLVVPGIGNFNTRNLGFV